MLKVCYICKRSVKFSRFFTVILSPFEWNIFLRPSSVTSLGRGGGGTLTKKSSEILNVKDAVVDVTAIEGNVKDEKFKFKLTLILTFSNLTFQYKCNCRLLGGIGIIYRQSPVKSPVIKTT